MGFAGELKCATPVLGGVAVAAGLIGRDGEITEISAILLATCGAPSALIITGADGIGKTAVWRHVVDSAPPSWKVISCQPARAESPLAFSALDDLLSDVAGQVLPLLPGPCIHALEAALLREPAPSALHDGRADDHEVLPEPRLVARGVLDALRILSADGPVLIAIDDANWLDRASSAVLEYCFRRLQNEPVAILLTVRDTTAAVPLRLDRALPPDRLRRMRLGPVSLGAMAEILRIRQDVPLPRHAVARLYEASGGNPFYALECARTLLERPLLALTREPIPVPQNLCDLVRVRIQRLTPPGRQVAWLVATSPDPRERQIRAACDDAESWIAIDQAIDAGVIERDGDALRFTHPLFRSVLYGEMTLNQRRSMHQRLAAHAPDIEARSWHLALGADKPGEATAGKLENAAAHAAARGAPEAAAALQEQAIRLTPNSRRDKIRDRMVRAADYHFHGGDTERSRQLIKSALATCPPGPKRASLLLRQATIQYHEDGWPPAEKTLVRAIEEARDDPAESAYAQQELAFARLVAGDLTAACEWASASLRSAERAADPHLVACSLARKIGFEFIQGRAARFDLLDAAEKLEASSTDRMAGRPSLLWPGLVRAVLLKWCDRFDDARVGLSSEYRRAIDAGREASLPFLLHHFSELECWAGNWAAAEKYAREGCRVAEDCHQRTMSPATLYSLALVRAHQGQVDETRELVRRALGLCEETGNVPVAQQLVSVLGFLAVSLDDHEDAHARLGPLAVAMADVGMQQPSVVRFLPDEIEALAALGCHERAKEFTRQLEERGKTLDRPWALATGARCRAHLAAIDGDLDAALAACDQALAHHKRLPMAFELGRTLLVKGKTERRARQKRAARDSLATALGIFEQLGATLWAQKTGRELSRVSARTSLDVLTDTEGRVATLVAQGMTNCEVASAMFVTENTVQTHVRHIFRKLGLRSRTELAARLLSTSARPS